jgi:hypothetical protein
MVVSEPVANMKFTWEQAKHGQNCIRDRQGREDRGSSSSSWNLILVFLPCLSKIRNGRIHVNMDGEVTLLSGSGSRRSNDGKRLLVLE